MKYDLAMATVKSHGRRDPGHDTSSSCVVGVCEFGGASEKARRPRRLPSPGCLAQREWIVPIPGTTKKHRVEENAAAADIELTEADLHEIEEAASQIEIQGARYPESSQQMVDR